MVDRPHPAALAEQALLAQVSFRRQKASGPGGQRRNKVETAVHVLHEPTGVAAQAAERRSAEVNRRLALGRLRLKLALQHRCPVETDGYRPSELWRRRTAGPRLAVADSHADVPALLAEALDVLAAVHDELPEAAALLDVTPSRLLRVLRLEPAALAALIARLSQTGRRCWR